LYTYSKPLNRRIPLASEEGFISHSPLDQTMGVFITPCNIHTEFNMWLTMVNL